MKIDFEIDFELIITQKSFFLVCMRAQYFPFYGLLGHVLLK